MTTLRDSKGAGSVGSINTQATPLAVDRPLVANGDLVLLGGFLASHLGSTTGGISDIVDLARVTGLGGGSNRLGGVFAAKVTDAAAFNAAVDFLLKGGASTTATRTLGVVGSYAPDAGKSWDLSTLVASGPEYNAAAQSNDLFPTIAARTDTFGISMTNKGASASLTRHVVPTGTLTIQQRSNSGATNENVGTETPNSNSVSDSVVSITRVPSGGGAQVNFVAQAADGSSSGTALSQAAGACIAFTVALDQVTDEELEPEPLPTVTGRGFGTVSKFLQTKHAVSAHRNFGLGAAGSSPADGYPEMTELGVRMAANAGAGLIEISCQGVDGGWIGMHDETPNRVIQETTYDGTAWSTLTLAQALALRVNAGTTGGPQPVATLQQLIETLPEDFIFMVDPKQQAATRLTEFLDILMGYGGPERFIIKIDGAAALGRFQAIKTHNPGWIVAAYFYDTTTNFATSIPPKLPYIDLAGLNVEPNLAAESYWTDLRAMLNAQTAVDGKTRYIWAHVIQSQARYDAAIARGADFLQVSNVALPKNGVSAWRPALGPDGFAVKEIYVGATPVAKVYRGSELIWSRT